MDGRVLIPTMNWVMDRFNTPFVDMITEPGLDGIISMPHYDLHDYVRKIDISIRRNNSKQIVVMAHEDCKGNPVCEKQHFADVKDCVKHLHPLFPDLPIMGIYVKLDGSVEEICDVKLKKGKKII